MKKRLLALLLLLVLLFTCALPTAASVSMCFVGVNDTIPLSLPGDAEPFYSGGTLYIPYSAFNANPGGVAVSYNTDQNTLVLFTRVRRLVYDLVANTLTDEADNTSDVAIVYRGGILFIPASAASHFGLSVSLLSSQAGYPILRFTNGSQVYDDELFVSKAENLISYVVENSQQETGSGTPSSETVPGVPATQPDPDPPEAEPATVYLVFAGDAVSQETLDLLAAQSLRVAFFLTEEQFVLQTNLVRTIYAAGHTVALTAEASSQDFNAALSAANTAMDRTLFCKSLLALVPEARPETSFPGYWVLVEPSEPLTVDAALAVSDRPQLLICRSNAAGTLQQLLDANAALPQLLETTILE